MLTYFKWAGNKRKELPLIKKWLPQSFDVYCEPFVGAGALWFDLLPHKSIIGDLNTEVCAFHKTLISNPKMFIDKLNLFALSYNKEMLNLNPSSKEDYKEISKKYYYDIRHSNFTSQKDIAFRFYIMRQLCFGGMIRYGKDGRFNVPYGYYKKIKIIKDIDLLALRKLNKTTVIYHDMWQKSVSETKKTDFVFLDPPYTRQFKQYSANSKFGNKEQIQLSEWFKSKQAQSLIVINKDEFTYNLYKEHIKEIYPVKYSIQYRDRMSDEDSNAEHLIATNY